MLTLLFAAAVPLSHGALLFSQKSVLKTGAPKYNGIDYTKVAIFSVGHDQDADTIQKTLTGFKLAQKVNTKLEGIKLDWFLVGDFQDKRILSESNIHYLHLPISHADEDAPGSSVAELMEIPKVDRLGTLNGLTYAHWWSAVPEELAKLGYGLSMWFNASEVVAMQPMKVEDATKTLKRTKATMAVSTIDWASYERPGTLINSGLVWFNNTAAQETHFFQQYSDFIEHQSFWGDLDGVEGVDTLKSKDEDSLKEFIKYTQSASQSGIFEQQVKNGVRNSNERITAATLMPEWQMVCKKSTPQMKEHYQRGNMPYFVHLGNCRGQKQGELPPAQMQLGLPYKAQTKWNYMLSEVLDMYV